MNVSLIPCKRTDMRYQHIRDRHYIENRGTHGQQLHYLVTLDGAVVGIISGASAAWAIKSRDEYFGLTKENKRVALPSIVSNVVFRLEVSVPNLATKVLSLWRKRVSVDWEARYGVEVHGFETFIIENETRKGTLYKADNWDFVGMTAGNSKSHKGLESKSVRVDTIPKMIYCKKIKGTKLSTQYESTWRGNKVRNTNQMELL